MVKITYRFFLSLILAFVFFSEITNVQAAEIMYVTSKNDIIMRATPSKDAKQIEIIPKNSKVEVIATKNEWSYITYNKDN